MLFDTKKLKEIIPYISSLLILLGFLKLNYFYAHFNINISNYIDLTECLILFFPHLIKYLFILFGINILFYLITSPEEDIENYQKVEEIIDNNKLKIRLKKFFFLNFWIFMQVISLTILGTISYFLNGKSAYIIITAALLLFTVLLSNFILLEFSRKYKLANKKKFDPTYNNFIIILVLIVCNSIHGTYHEIKSIENHKGDSVCFKYNSSLIQSEDNVIFVGQTRNFIFMYNNLTSETSVYPKDRLDELTIRKQE